MTADQVRDMLRRECAKRPGGQREWAVAHGLSPSYVSEAIRGRRDLGPLILRELGLVKRVSYEREK